MSLQIHTKRVQAEASPDDGQRVLVDRLWPRGISKDAAKLDSWLKEIAPSDALRKWFGHDPARWDEFRNRYFQELRDNPEAVAKLMGMAKQGRLTLLFSAKDEQHNNAAALRDFMRETRK